ncbi:MAG: hypothetical protein WAL99_01380 [Pseudonocardiaceae bacterium]
MNLVSARFVDEPCAIVTGAPAWLISRLLRSPDVATVLNNPPSWIDRAEVTATVTAIHLAGRAFVAPPSALERGNQPTSSAVAAESELTTRETAERLCLSQRRVQEIAAELGGTQVDRRWRIPEVAVREYERTRTGKAA